MVDSLIPGLPRRGETIDVPPKMVPDTAALRRSSATRPQSISSLRKGSHLAPAQLSPRRPSRGEIGTETRSYSPFSTGSRRTSKDQNSNSQSSMATIRANVPHSLTESEALKADGKSRDADKVHELPSVPATQRATSVNLAQNRLSDFGNRANDFFETDSSDVDESGSEYTEPQQTMNSTHLESLAAERPEMAADAFSDLESKPATKKDADRLRKSSTEYQASAAKSVDAEDKPVVRSLEESVASQARTEVVATSRFDESTPGTPFPGGTNDRNWLQRPWSENPQYYPYGLPAQGRDDGRFSTQTTVNTIGGRSNRSTGSQLAGRRGDRMLYAHAITMKSLANLEAGPEDDDAAIDVDAVMGKTNRLSTGKRPASAQSSKDVKEWRIDVPPVSSMPDENDNDPRDRVSLKEKPRSISAGPGKRVSVIPPPIELRSRSASTAEIVKTPFPNKELMELRKELRRPQPLRQLSGNQPHSILRNHRGTESNRSPMTPLSQQCFRVDSILPISVHRRYKPHSRFIGRLIIPADPELIRKTTAAARRRSTLANLKAGKETECAKKEADVKASREDFDDAMLFTLLRNEYHNTLLGDSRLARFWRRCLSLRVIKRIVLIALEDRPLGSGTDVERHGAHILEGLRSPRLLARKGLSETFSEDRLYKHFSKPKLGKGQYAWVHWAHRVSQDVEEEYEFDEETGMVLVPQRTHNEAGEPIPGGLEFIEGWSIRRIGLASLIVVSISILPALIWILTGPAPADARLPQHEPWTAGLEGNDAEGRVVSGMLIAIVLGSLGWAVLALWALASWLMM